MDQQEERKGAQDLQWIACGVATLAALLHLLHLGGEILLSPVGKVTTLNVLIACLLGLYSVSLLLCWKWLAVSGWLSLAAIGAFSGIILQMGMAPNWLVWLMLTLPSLLLLAAAWVSRAPKTSAPDE